MVNRVQYQETEQEEPKEQTMDFSQLLSPTIFAWSILTVVVGIVVGFVIGRTYTLQNEPKKLKEDRSRTLEALSKLLESTKQFNTDVGTHSKELKSVRQSVTDMQHDGIESVQEVLIEQISMVVESNKKMENDLVMTQYQLEEQAQEIDRTRKEARTDELSGLQNRKAFDEALNYLITRYKSKGVSFALLLCDVDHFKRINDTFGHQAGDEVVKRIGETLKDCVRPHDHVARFGGDEFAILLDEVNTKVAHDVAVRMRGTVERTNFTTDDGSGDLAVTLSMGLAVVTPEETMESILKRADQALYRSKEQGRNQLHCWNEKDELVRSLQ